MTKASDDFGQWSGIELLAGLIYGEARGESFEGKVLVGMTAMNRARHPDHWNWGGDLREVCLSKGQFNCFDQGNSNRVMIRNLHRQDGFPWMEYFILAEKIFAGAFDYYVQDRPTHYFNPAISSPAWADELRHLYDVGSHRFFSCFPAGGVLP